MTWVLIIAAAWLVVSVVVALLIAGTIRLADQRRKAALQRSHDNFVVDLRSAADVPSSADGPEQPAAKPHRSLPPVRTPVVGDCIPPSERATGTRQTGTR